MKHCPSCQTSYPDEMLYCPKCGQQLVDTPVSGTDEGPASQGTSPGKPFRKIVKWFILALCVAAFFVYRYYHSTTYLLLEPSEVSLPIKGEKTVDVDINYDGHSYSIKHAPSWIHVDKGDNKFSLQAEANRTGEDRTAIIVIESGSITQALPVSQQGKATYLLVNPTSLSFERESKEERVSVDCDGLSFDIDSAPSWVDVRKREDCILVSVETNTSSSNKEGFIVLSSGNIATRIPVRQGGAATFMRLEPSSLTFPKGAGSLGESRTCGVDYDGYDFDITYQSDWISAEKEDNRLVVRAEDNTTGANRTGSVTIRSGDISKTLSVTQNGKATRLEVDRKSISDDRYGGRSFTIRVTSDGTSYRVNYPNFLEVDCRSDYFTVRFPSNSDGSYRTGTIRVEEDNQSKSISVAQGGKCNSCGGSGKTNCAQCFGAGGWNNGFTGWATCFMCHGAGSFKCSSCNGTGYRDP